MSAWPDLAMGPITTWPGTRTPDDERQRSNFGVPLSTTLAELSTELGLIRARDVRLEIALQPRDFRLDGKPRAGVRAEHPGVVLRLTAPDLRPEPLAYATDRFHAWQDNLRAIVYALHDLRRLERYGVATRGQQHAGFAQLGAGGPDAGRGAQIVARHDHSIVAALMATHPDRGGDPRDFADVRAYQAAATTGSVPSGGTLVDHELIPWTPGPSNDSIDLEQIGLKGAMTLDEDLADFAFRRGQRVRLSVTGIIEGFGEGARRSANTVMTVRKIIIDAGELESIELLGQPEARTRRDGQIEGQLDLNAVPDDAGANAGLADADVKGRDPDLGRQPVLATLADGEQIERGSRWIHTTGTTYRAMAKATAGDDELIYVVNVSDDTEDSFPLASFGQSLARADIVEAAVPDEDPETARLDAIEAARTEELRGLMDAGPVTDGKVKQALGDARP